MMSPIFVVLIAMIVVSAGAYVDIEHRIFWVYSVVILEFFQILFSIVNILHMAAGFGAELL